MTKRVLLLGFAALMLTGWVSCTKPDHKVNFYIDANILKHTALVQFKDLKTNLFVENVNVSFKGPDAQYVYNIVGERISESDKIDGVLQIGLDPNRVVTATNPVRFTIVAKKGDYLTVNKDVVVLPSDSQKIVEMPMVNQKDLPNGVASVTKTGTIGSDGALNNLMTVATDADGTTKFEKITVSVPAGTKFMDVNMAPLSGSSMKADIVHFDTRTEQTLAAFPGGLDPLEVILEDGSKAPLNFVSAGFANINMEVANSQVKHFSRPVTITMTMAKTTKNPVTNVPVQPNDRMPIWSYDIESGVWQSEKDAVIKEVNGNYQVEFETDHLTWYNIGYTGSRCAQTAQFTISAPWMINPEDYLMKLYSVSGAYLASSYIRAYNNSTFGFYESPDQPVYIKIYEYNSWWLSDVPVLEVPAPVNLCTATSTTLSIPQPANVGDTVRISIYGICANQPNRKVRPDLYVFFKNPSSSAWNYLGFLQTGKMTTRKLTVGQTYDFGTYFNGNWYSTTVAVSAKNNEASMVIPSGFCNF